MGKWAKPVPDEDSEDPEPVTPYRRRSRSGKQGRV